jgi:hypothetical protein
MSKYRCPICGATHKQYQPNCRLCGQSLAAENIPTDMPKAATPASANASIKGVFLIGLAVVLVLLVGGVAFGVVQSNRAIETAKEAVLQQNVDGWSPLVCVVEGAPAAEGAATEAAPTCIVPAGQGFRTELPGDRTKSNTVFAPAAGGTMETWSSTISSDTLLEVAFAPVTDPATGAAPVTTEKAAMDGITDAWLAGEGLSREVDSTGGSDVRIQETTFAGFPARLVNTPSREIAMGAERGYLRTLLVLRKDVLFVVQSTSIYESSEPFDRMVRALVFT